MNGLRKNLVWAFVICNLFFAGAKICKANGEVTVGLDFFYDRLAPYGEWFEYQPHGWCWRPYNVPVDWRPYTDGHWAYSDDCGWLWVSDVDWGWACYHYGRWGWDDAIGWYWVPGYQWGPSWCAFRQGPGCIGWAPLPPEVGWEINIGFVWRNFDPDRIPWRWWSFCDERRFLEPHINRHLFLVANSVTFIGRTKNITNVTFVGGRIMNNCFRLDAIEKITDRRIAHLHIRDVPTVAARFHPGWFSNDIGLFRPHIKPAPVGIRPPIAARPPIGKDIERWQKTEREQIFKRQETERKQLFQRQESEMKIRKEEEWRKQREAETNAMKAEHERQNRLLEQRQQAERQRWQMEKEHQQPQKPHEAAPPQQRGAGPGPGKGQGKIEGQGQGKSGGPGPDKRQGGGQGQGQSQGRGEGQGRGQGEEKDREHGGGKH